MGVFWVAIGDRHVDVKFLGVVVDANSFIEDLCRWSCGGETDNCRCHEGEVAKENHHVVCFLMRGLVGHEMGA